jgi:AraC-like DNA-binding protein
MSTAGTNSEIVVWRYQGETNLTIRGPETRASLVECPIGAEFLGIVFKLGTFMPPLPARKLVDDAVTLPEATGNNFWLHGSVWQIPDFENADTFINHLIRDDLLMYDPVVAAALKNEPLNMPARTLRHRFLRATGLTQGEIYQIERAHRAAALLEQGSPILDVVYEAGYFDQPHLTRSLKRFIGYTPAQMSRQPT